MKFFHIASNNRCTYAIILLELFRRHSLFAYTAIIHRDKIVLDWKQNRNCCWLFNIYANYTFWHYLRASRLSCLSEIFDREENFRFVSPARLGKYRSDDDELFWLSLLYFLQIDGEFQLEIVRRECLIYVKVYLFTFEMRTTSKFKLWTKSTQGLDLLRMVTTLL